LRPPALEDVDAAPGGEQIGGDREIETASCPASLFGDAHPAREVGLAFLVASVVGVAFEAGQDAHVMTTTAFGSALVFWLAHWWSEVIGEQISVAAVKMA
jgi:hypothetical protein